MRCDRKELLVDDGSTVKMLWTGVVIGVVECGFLPRLFANS
jgi:hypothetical protein